MTDTGTWMGNHASLAYAALDRVRVGAPLADQIVRELSQAGLLVSTAFYLPTIDELYRNWQQMRYVYSGGLKPRWVMCAETWAALGDRYSNQKAAVLGELTWSLAVEPATYEPPQSVFVVNVLGNRLFGEVVRIDPAARRPMWEVTD